MQLIATLVRKRLFNKKSWIPSVWKLSREPGLLLAYLTASSVPFTDTLGPVVYLMMGGAENGRDWKSLKTCPKIGSPPPTILTNTLGDSPWWWLLPMRSPWLLSPSRFQRDAFNTKQSPRIRWQQLLPLHPKHCLSAKKYVWNAPSLYYTGARFHCRGYSKPLKDVGRSTDHAIRLCSDCFWHGCLETILIKTSWP